MDVPDGGTFVERLTVHELQEGRRRLGLVEEQHVDVETAEVEALVEFRRIELEIAAMHARQQRYRDAGDAVVA